MTSPAYEYNATLRRIVDGDTLDLDVDLGFDFRAITRFRLLGVDTPEVVGVDKALGLASRAFTQNWLAAQGGQVLIRSYKAHQREKYGRWLVEAYPPGGGLSLNTELLVNGFATAMTDKGTKHA